MSMFKQLGAQIAAVVTLATLVGSVAAGTWWMSQLENRITRVEDNAEAFNQIHQRISILETRLTINDTRWALHFDLWGDEIRNEERRRGRHGSTSLSDLSPENVARSIPSIASPPGIIDVPVQPEED